MKLLIATALMAAPKKADPNVKLLDILQVNLLRLKKEIMNLLFADNPNQADLVPHVTIKTSNLYGERRALRAEGKIEEVLSVKQMKSGQLKITPGLTLQITAQEYDSAASKLKRLRYVVYMPWASKSTGLPEVPRSSNHP
jgi:hypothetical protein